MYRQMLDFCRLGRGTKPNMIDGALPNLPKTGLSDAIGHLGRFQFEILNFGHCDLFEICFKS
jgi:hypothetical protein